MPLLAMMLHAVALFIIFYGNRGVKFQNTF